MYYNINFMFPLVTLNYLYTNFLIMRIPVKTHLLCSFVLFYVGLAVFITRIQQKTIYFANNTAFIVSSHVPRRVEPWKRLINSSSSFFVVDNLYLASNNYGRCNLLIV